MSLQFLGDQSTLNVRRTNIPTLGIKSAHEMKTELSNNKNYQALDRPEQKFKIPLISTFKLSQLNKKKTNSQIITSNQQTKLLSKAKNIASLPKKPILQTLAIRPPSITDAFAISQLSNPVANTSASNNVAETNELPHVRSHKDEIIRPDIIIPKKISPHIKTMTQPYVGSNTIYARVTNSWKKNPLEYFQQNFQYQPNGKSCKQSYSFF